MFAALVISWCFPLKRPTDGGAIYFGSCNIQLIEVSEISMDLTLTMIDSRGPSVVANSFCLRFVVSAAAARFIKVAAYDV